MTAVETTRTPLSVGQVGAFGGQSAAPSSSSQTSGSSDMVKEAKLSLRKSGDGQEDYFIITLKDARITGVHHNVIADGFPGSDDTTVRGEKGAWDVAPLTTEPEPAALSPRSVP